MRRKGRGAVLSTVAAVAMAVWALGTTAAPVYRLVDGDGRVTFADVPSAGAEPFVQGTANTYRAHRPQPRATDRAVVQSETFAGYRSVAIQSPKEEAIRANDGRIRVVAATEPDLQSGHRAVVLLDGKATQPSASLTFDLAGLDRGRHELAVRIVDGKGQVLAQSRPKIIHLLRVSRPVALK